MVTRLDRNVGRLIETLERLDLTRDTLIVFTSDHGATFESGNQGTSAALDSNRPFRGQKRTLWEGGIRVPALACWPGRIPAGVVAEDVMHLTDLLPTFVAAAGGRWIPPGTSTGSTSWRLDRQGEVRRTHLVLGMGRAKDRDQLAALEANSSSSSPEGANPSSTTSWATPPNAATFPPSIRN